MPWDRFVLGYHGCDRSIVTDIVTRKRALRHSKNDYDWLGNGAYFWEDSYARALQWAAEDLRVRKPAVLGAVINLGNCLNLVDVEHLTLVKEAYRYLQETSKAAEAEMPSNGGRAFKLRKLDCAVIETLHQIRKEKRLQSFDTVRGFFIEGEPLYPGAGFRQQDHIQLCVRNEANIIGYFIPRSRATTRGE